jgi:hypothetical protein
MRAHPEGGWYVETWRATEPPGGGRATGSAILYLLAAGERSHWHAVDAAEIWQWSAGDPLELSVWAEGGQVTVHRLGGNVTGGELPQVVVAAGAWQAARPLGAWTLVGCIVTPAFEFDGFRLAPAGWEPPTPR